MASLQEAIETSPLKEYMLIEKKGAYAVLDYKSGIRKVPGWAQELDRVEALSRVIEYKGAKNDGITRIGS